MLFGLALIAVPLLVAIVNAGLQIRALADRGQKLVEDGVVAARASQDLFAQIAFLERTARLYEVLKEPNLLDVYRKQDERLSATRAQLYRQLQARPSGRDLCRRRSDARRFGPRVARLQAQAAPGPWLA